MIAKKVKDDVFLFFKPKLKPTALLYLELMMSRASLRRSKQDPPFHKPK
jgi:hypothetical protein